MGSLTGKRVLLVEDNFLIGAALREVLRSMGCVVVGPVAETGEASRLAQECEVDVGVLDINIVGGTSVAAAEALSRRKRPVIFVTGYASPKLLPPSLEAVRRIQKPVDERELRTALLEACG